MSAPADNGGRATRSLALSRVLSTAWLVLVWVAVTGSYSVASILGGTIVALLITTLFRTRPHDGPVHRVRPVALARYVAYFARELVLANIEVARAVIDPSRVANSRGIVEVRVPPSSRLVGAIIANAVSLTPGSSIIEVSQSPPSLHVHVLSLRSVDAVRSSVAELQWRLIAAIGPEHTLAEAVEHAAALRQRLADSGNDVGDGATAPGDEEETP